MPGDVVTAQSLVGATATPATAAKAPVVAMVAGETSGDLLAALLLDGLRSRWPALKSLGIGGPRMSARGFDALWPSHKLSVLGYVDVLLHYREIATIRRQLLAQLLNRRPDVFVGVDAPDFNLALHARLRAAGIKTVQFVSPSIWASRPGRIDQIKAGVDHVLCLFPFEPALLARHGVAATFVGHPLADMIPLQCDRAAARLALGLAPQAPVVAVLPGSRASEIAYIAPRFFKAVALISRARPEVRFVLPAVPALRAEIERLLHIEGLTGRVLVTDGQSHTALAACDLTLIASGTATLEAALFKRPMVIAYRMNWLSWQLKGRRKTLPWVGLPNILCREFVVPELLQDAATPAALAQAVFEWLDAFDSAPEKIRLLEEKFMQLHLQLRRDTARLASDAIQQVLES